MLIDTRQFSGERPKLSDRLISENEATIALDCELVSGEIRSIRENKVVAPARVSDARTLFIADDEFFTYAGDLDVQETPVDAAVRRLFITGDGAPKQFDVDSGVTYRLGVPKPLGQPEVYEISGTPGASQIPTDSLYRFTYLNRWGEEGDASDSSEVFTYTSGQTLKIRNLGYAGSSASSLEDYGIVGYRLYRLAESESKFVGEYPISQSEVTDTLLESELGEVISSEDFYGPPLNLRGLHVMGNGVGLGFVGHKVYVSEPYNLNAWPYDFDVYSDVVAISSFDTNAVILTTGYPVIAAIFDPTNISPSELAEREPCVARRGVVQGLGGVMYPAPTGLFFIGNSGGQMLTQDYLDEDDWRELRPDTFSSAFRDGEYIAFYGTVGDGGGWVFDTRESNAVVRHLTQWGSAVYVREGTDDLYVVNENLIELYQGGELPVDYYWQSKRYGDGSPFALTTRRINSYDFANNLAGSELIAENQRISDIKAANATSLSAALLSAPQQSIGGAVGQVVFGGVSLGGDLTRRLPTVSGDRSVTLTVFGETDVVHQEKILVSDVERMDYADRQRYWQYALVGNATVTQVSLAGSATELYTGS